MYSQQNSSLIPPGSKRSDEWAALEFDEEKKSPAQKIGLAGERCTCRYLCLGELQSIYYNKL
jgi:hypothetical protein